MKKKILYLVIPVLLVFVVSSCDKQNLQSDLDPSLKGAAAYIDVSLLTEISSSPVDLIAGQTMTVGKVHFTTEDLPEGGKCVKVKFVTDAPWILGEVHVAVVSDPNVLINRAGNPVIGKFPVNVSFMTSENKTEYETECLTMPSTGPVFIAAHAVVCSTDEIIGYKEPDFASICASLPSTAIGAVTGMNKIDGYNYIRITEGGVLDGNYSGWCIDADGRNWSPNVSVFCSLGDLSSLTGISAHPENMFLINYILNQNYIGTTPIEGEGAITAGDIQKAIWIILDDNETCTLGLTSPFDMDRVWWIVNQASTYDLMYDSYLPECNGRLAVVLIPKDAMGNYAGQAAIITIPVPCEPIYNCETAWGNGFEFPGDSWAMFFRIY